MNTRLIIRITLALAAAGLFLLALAYWWQGNLFHEIVGSSLFGVLIVHNVFNRRWYGAVPRGRYDARRWVGLLNTVALLLAMVVLFVTSIVISRGVFGFLGLKPPFTVREIHVLAAYWTLLIFSLHLGTHWQRVMGASRGLFGVSAPNPMRTFLLRVLAAAIAAFGAYSVTVMTLDAKLSNQYLLDMWDFSAATSAFFAHYLAIVGLCVCIGHYSVLVMKSRRDPVHT